MEENLKINRLKGREKYQEITITGKSFNSVPRMVCFRLLIVQKVANTRHFKHVGFKKKRS